MEQRDQSLVLEQSLARAQDALKRPQWRLILSTRGIGLSVLGAVLSKGVGTAILARFFFRTRETTTGISAILWDTKTTQTLHIFLD